MPQGHDLSSMLWASMAVAAAALSARLVVWLPPRRLGMWLPWLQAIAAGMLLGDALMHMLPEAMAYGLGPGQAGTRLAREWHGKTHHVLILDEGYLFEDRRYGSLTAIAREITGAAWSGPRFFGLQGRAASEGR